ncbi:hypothetical protein SNK04_005252 [Fusarium graminearum]
MEPTMELQSSECSTELLNYKLAWESGHVCLPREVVTKHEEFEQLFEIQGPNLACLDAGPGCPCVAQILVFFLLCGKYRNQPTIEHFPDEDELEEGAFHRFAIAVEVYRRAILWKLPELSYPASDEFNKAAESLYFAQIILHLTSENWILGGENKYYALAELIVHRAGEIREGEQEEEGIKELEKIWRASSYVSDLLVAGLLVQREKLKAVMRLIEPLTKGEEE